MNIYILASSCDSSGAPVSTLPPSNKAQSEPLYTQAAATSASGSSGHSSASVHTHCPLHTLTTQRSPPVERRRHQCYRDSLHQLWVRWCSKSRRKSSRDVLFRTHTVSLTLRTLTVSEDTHCGGNLWHHYSIKTQEPISRKLTESIWCFGDRMSLERLRCSGWVSGWDQLNQPDVDLNFPDPSL